MADQDGSRRVQRAADPLGTSSSTGMFAFVGHAVKAWSEARRRAREEEHHYNRALREARIIADLSRAMNGLAVENIRRYD
ncbi:hypothetical protein [Diaphorobacter ruginosibacter]|jgi:hypothetical protein|uniref:hypothetical protein n=1 Tax=Diaphorobacter ruginosibacter TaxID=1715720 RepID=UPI00333F087C